MAHHLYLSNQLLTYWNSCKFGRKYHAHIFISFTSYDNSRHVAYSFLALNTRKQRVTVIDSIFNIFPFELRSDDANDIIKTENVPSYYIYGIHTTSAGTFWVFIGPLFWLNFLIIYFTGNDGENSSKKSKFCMAIDTVVIAF